MFNLLPRLEAEFPWLHTRAGTEDDFYECCRRHGVMVAIRPDFPSGVYIAFGEHHFILLNSSLRGWFLRYVMFHELGHFLFHAPTQSSLAVEFCDPHVRQKNHIEAEQVAALILFPMSELDEVYESGAFDAYTEVAELVSVRLGIRAEIGK